MSCSAVIAKVFCEASLADEKLSTRLTFATFKGAGPLCVHSEQAKKNGTYRWGFRSHRGRGQTMGFKKLTVRYSEQPKSQQGVRKKKILCDGMAGMVLVVWQ